MKKRDKQYSCVVWGLSTLLASIGTQANPVPDSSVTIQRDKALVQSYHNADVLWRRQGKALPADTTQMRAVQQVAGNGMTAVGASSTATFSDIALPGTAQNNTRLKNAMSSARNHFTALKTARTQSSYGLHQNLASVALDTAVSSYLHGRQAAHIPMVVNETENDLFLQTMAALKMDTLNNALTATELNDMLDRLASARAILVDITVATE